MTEHDIQKREKSIRHSLNAIAYYICPKMDLDIQSLQCTAKGNILEAKISMFPCRNLRCTNEELYAYFNIVKGDLKLRPDQAGYTGIEGLYSYVDLPFTQEQEKRLQDIAKRITKEKAPIELAAYIEQLEYWLNGLYPDQQKQKGLVLKEILSANGLSPAVQRAK